MYSPNRDLLVLSKKASEDEAKMKIEISKLHELLFHVKSIENFCLVNEIIDLNSYKVIRQPNLIEKLIQSKKLKPFQFINNKN